MSTTVPGGTSAADSAVTYPSFITTAVRNLNPNARTHLINEITQLYIDMGSTHVTAEQLELIHRQCDSYYLPMYAYFKVLMEKHRVGQNKKGKNEPLYIGLSAPQGCGKTTLTDMMVSLFALDGKRAVAMSLDDFYLTGADQDKVTTASSSGGGNTGDVNPLLKLRGNAGTHDLSLLYSTITDINEHRESFYSSNAVSDSGTGTDIGSSSSSSSSNSSSSSSSSSSNGKTVKLPRYDKSLRLGKGDRAPQSEWFSVGPADAPIDVVLFEGWMLGFSPLSTEGLQAQAVSCGYLNEDDTTHNPITVTTSSSDQSGGSSSSSSSSSTHPTLENLMQINLNLEQYDALHALFYGWVVVALTDIQYGKYNRMYICVCVWVMPLSFFYLISYIYHLFRPVLYNTLTSLAFPLLS